MDSQSSVILCAFRAIRSGVILLFFGRPSTLSTFERIIWWGTAFCRSKSSSCLSLSLMPCSASTSRNVRRSLGGEKFLVPSHLYHNHGSRVWCGAQTHCLRLVKYFIISFPHSSLLPCPYPGQSIRVSPLLIQSSKPPFPSSDPNPLLPWYVFSPSALVSNEALCSNLPARLMLGCLQRCHKH